MEVGRTKGSHHQVRAVCCSCQDDLRKARQWKASFSRPRGPWTLSDACTPVNRGLFVAKERVVLGAEGEWSADKEVFGWIDSAILTYQRVLTAGQQQRFPAWNNSVLAKTTWQKWLVLSGLSPGHYQCWYSRAGTQEAGLR